MSRPLYRGFSGGGRGSGGAGHDFFDVSYQAKDLGENGFGHELMSPAGTNRSRQSLIFTFLKLGLVVFIVLSLSSSLYWAISISTSSGGNIHRGYRRLQEQVVADLTEIGELSLGIARLKELEFCPPEYENYAPCYNNVSEDFDLVDPLVPIEYERNCVPDAKKGCLILPPRNYRIPLRWPGGRDIIWKENVKITGHEFSSGSLTKRMMVEEEQISFRSGSLMVDGVEDYTHQIAEMIGLPNESNFIESGIKGRNFKYRRQQKLNTVYIRKAGPAVCGRNHDVESPYYQPLNPCIAGTRSRRWIPIECHTPWPSRASLNSTELDIHGVHPEDFAEDAANWNSVIHNFWSLLSPLIFSDHPKRPGDEDPSPPFNMLRNVLDMNAHFGGFNAALLDAGKSVWVMNVVPTSGPNYLPLIFDRGCEAFPTYPRTYDMVHADGLLSLETRQKHRCSMLDIFLEIDRILRPEGWVIIRDATHLVEAARSMTTQLRWDARMVELDSSSDKKLLNQKQEQSGEAKILQQPMLCCTHAEPQDYSSKLQPGNSM
ncbi:hypothetical protein MUK42_25145, partial [Musa troglodytarum]